MSELTNARANRTNFRFQLLATVSAIALLSSMVGAAKASDDDNDHPTIWIELGGQLSRLDDGQDVFAPEFPNSPPRPSTFSSSQKFEKSPLYSVDETGKISFQPSGSDWVFSASVRYGRSVSKKDVNQQTYPKSFLTKWIYSQVNHVTRIKVPLAAKFADTRAQTSESHAVLDFQAGKDIGLGMLGVVDGSSAVSLGVRVAQFNRKSNIALKSDPDWHRQYKYFTNPYFIPTRIKIDKAEPYHSNVASLQATRSFHGIGPSLSWNASAPLLGDTKGGEVAFDWGLNAALLFGRQKAKTRHQTTGRYHTGTQLAHPSLPQPFRPITFQGPATPDHTRSRMVTVPNVGGFAGLSFHVENFKVSAGYRADLFFSAMDGGIDAAKNENVGFYGPFASVSVGIGG